jgi:hypothetical protein
MVTVKSLEISAFLIMIAVLLAACAPRSHLPVSASFTPIPDRTIVLVGTGEAYKYMDGAWVHAPEYNYEFSVIQRRYPDRWESIKEMHRRHPDYNGLAGPRDQTHYFVIQFEKEKNDTIPFSAETTMGTGEGKANGSFTEVVVELEPDDVSVFAPFNMYRITQHYHYKEGYVRETVEVIKRKDGKEYPFMKMEEKALIFVRVKPGGHDDQ